MCLYVASSLVSVSKSICPTESELIDEAFTILSKYLVGNLFQFGFGDRSGSFYQSGFRLKRHDPNDKPCFRKF